MKIFVIIPNYNHNGLREVLSCRYLNLMKLSFFKEIRLVEFFWISFLYKSKNQWLKRLK